MKCEQTIIVARLDGSRALVPEPVMVVSPFAIHRAPSVPWGYNITHIPTGYSVNQCPISTQEAAQALVKKLALLEAPWDSTDPETLRLPAVRRLIDESGR